MSLQVSHYNMLRASHEVSQKVVVRTVITVRFVPGADVGLKRLFSVMLAKSSGSIKK
ncbi:hypothetical protein SJ257_21465, partial [Citrobacter freundii]|nr:hypothetical protein [Citrobacter freundii]